MATEVTLAATTAVFTTIGSIQTATPSPSDRSPVSTDQASFNFGGLFDSVGNIMISVASAILILGLGFTIGWCVRGIRSRRSRHNSEKMASSGSNDSAETQITVDEDIHGTIQNTTTGSSKRQRQSSVRDYTDQCLTSDVDGATIDRMERKKFQQRPTQLTLKQRQSSENSAEGDKFLTMKTVSPFPAAESSKYATLQPASEPHYASLQRKPKFASVGQYPPATPVSPPRVPNAHSFPSYP